MNRLLAWTSLAFCAGSVLTLLTYQLFAIVAATVPALITLAMIPVLIRRSRKMPRHAALRIMCGSFCLLIGFEIGCQFAGNSVAATERTSHGLFSLTPSGSGSVLITAYVDGAETQTANSLSFPCRVLSVYGARGSQTLSPSPTVWLSVSLHARFHTVLTRQGNSTFQERFYSSAKTLTPGSVFAAYVRFHRVPKGPFANALLRRSITVLASSSIFGINRIYADHPIFDLYSAQGYLLTLLQKRVTTAYGKMAGSFLLAFAIGDRLLLQRSIVNVFVALGIVHALVASGATIRMTVSPMVRFFQSRTRSRAYWLYGFALAFVLALLFLTGMAPPAIRAAIVYIYEIAAQASHRTRDRLTANALSAVCLTLIEPHLLLDTGVVLSYAAMAALAFLPSFFEKTVCSALRPRFLRAMVARGCAAEVGITPLVAVDFGQLSLASLFMNMVLYPVLEWVLPVSFLLVIIANVNPQRVAGMKPIAEILFNSVANGLTVIGHWPLVLKFTPPSYFDLMIYDGLVFATVLIVKKYTSRHKSKYSR